MSLWILFLSKSFGSLYSYGGEVPVSVWLAIGYEGVLALFMTLFLFQLFLPMPDFLHKRWTAERMGAALLIGALVLTACLPLYLVMFPFR